MLNVATCEKRVPPRWGAAAAITVLCCTVAKLLSSPAEPEWISIPQHHALNESSRPALPFGSHQESRANARFRHAFEHPKQPIISRIAAINPTVVALPSVESEQSPETTISHELETSLHEANAPDETQALSGDAKQSLSFAGIWAPTPNACSPGSNDRQLLPAVIHHEGAWAGDVSCRFRRIKQSGNVAIVTSTCSDGRQRWTNTVRLSVTGDRLKWSSERGSQTYVRCAPRIIEARANL
jgi:hypothetical protein